MPASRAKWSRGCGSKLSTQLGRPRWRASLHSSASMAWWPRCTPSKLPMVSAQAGAMPAKSYIGGQIEIHGQDQVPMDQTLGCIMLSNQHIDKLFDLVEAGTPVTIVGAVKSKNSVSKRRGEERKKSLK